MEEKSKVDHLAGIVPIASPDSFFNMPWHDCLMPITENYLAIENAVFNCALAGCDSIWIVCHMDTQPLVRKRVGEMILDPLTYYSSDDFTYTRHDKKFRRREIQIFYIPIHPKDRDKRDSLGDSVLYGTESILRVSSSITRWIVPSKMFVSFPYGIIPHQLIYHNRKNFRQNNNTIITFDDKTIKDGLMLPFTFRLKNFTDCKQRLKDYAVYVWEKSNYQSMVKLKFSLQEVFNALDISTAKMLQSEWFYQIDNWESYKNFLASEESLMISKRDHIFLKDKRSELDFGDQ